MRLDDLEIYKLSLEVAEDLCKIVEKVQGLRLKVKGKGIDIGKGCGS